MQHHKIRNGQNSPQRRRKSVLEREEKEEDIE